MSDDIVERLRGAPPTHSTLDRYEAAAEITRLRADLAAERRDHEATKIGHSLAMKRAAEEARQARADLAAAREALKPFAATYKHDIGNDEADDDAFVPMTKHNRAPRLTVGHFQRAYAAWFKGEEDE